MGNAERTEPVNMIGPKGLEKVVSALRTIAPELPFPIQYIELKEPKETITLGQENLKIEAFRVNHNILCYGYSIVIDRIGKFQVEKAMAYEVPKTGWGKLQKGESVEVNGKTITPDMVLGESRKGIKLTYCTDTRPTASIVEAAVDSDLFICEGMYGEEGKEEKAKEYKHMTFYEAAQIAKEANPRQMWLTHYSPSLMKPEEFMPKVKKIFANAEAGKDGKTIQLKFENEE